MELTILFQLFSCAGGSRAGWSLGGRSLDGSLSLQLSFSSSSILSSSSSWSSIRFDGTRRFNDAAGVALDASRADEPSKQVAQTVGQPATGADLNSRRRPGPSNKMDDAINVAPAPEIGPRACLLVGALRSS